MRTTTLTILLIFLFSHSKPQKLSKSDSADLFQTWKETADLLRKQDTMRLRALCLDSIYCTLCGFPDDTIVETHQSLSVFFTRGLDYLCANKKLWGIIDSEAPHLVVPGYIDKNGDGERVYGIAYLFWKPDYAIKSEGGQVIFDYVRRKSGYKLSSISTVP